MIHDDSQLLAAFARDGSPEAFRLLVERHVDLVYSAARRQMRDPHDADDVTQAVFIVLARRAHTIRNPALLPAWLLKVTHFAATNARKAAARRRRYEEEVRAMTPNIAPPQPDAEWDKLSPHIDAALARLSDADRAAIIAHCIQQQSIPECAAALKISEPAARKRIQRAIERLRALLAPQTSAPAVALPALIAAHALLPAPTALSSGIAVTALSASGATGTASFLIAQGVSHMLRATSLTRVAVAVAALCIVSLVSTALILKAAAPVAPASVTAASVPLPPGNAPAPTTASVQNRAPVLYRGVLVDADGKPAANAVVRTYTLDLMEGGERLESETHTAADGTFSLGPLPNLYVYEGLERGLLAEAPGAAVAWLPEQTLRFEDPTALRIQMARPAEVAGTLTNAKGQPVAGAVVEAIVGAYDYDNSLGISSLAIRLAATSDAQGRFRFDRIPAGTRLHLTVRHPEYQTWSTKFLVNRGPILPVAAGTTDVDIQLEDHPATLRVQLTRGGIPRAQAGVVLVADEPAKNRHERAVTDASGQAVFTGLPAGTWQLGWSTIPVNLPNLFVPMEGIALQTGETLDVVPEVATIPVRITVLEGDSTAQGRYWVGVRAMNAKRFVTDTPPKFTNPCEILLTAGRYQLVYSSREGGTIKDLSQDFSVAADGPPVNLTTRAISGPQLHGRLVDSAGKPLAGLVFFDFGNLMAVADADGRFAIEVPYWNRAVACLAFDDRRKLGRAFTLPAIVPTDTDLKLVLEPMGAITGKAVDAAGGPLPDTQVEVLFPDPENGRADARTDWLWHASIDAEGTFRVAPVPVGCTLEVDFRNRDQFADMKGLSLQGGETRDVGPRVLHGPVLETRRARRAVEALKPDPSLVLPPRDVWDATLAGRLLGEDGKPVVGVELYLLLIDDKGRPFTIDRDAGTDLKGRFTFGGLPRNKRIGVKASVLDSTGHYIQCVWYLTPDTAPVDLQVNAEARAAASQP